MTSDRMAARKPIVFGTIAVAAVCAVVWYFAGGDRSLTTGDSSATQVDRSGGGGASTSAAPTGATVNAAPADPRLHALAVSPDNGLIEFVRSADGKVIREVDDDPGSPRYGKSLREYTYLGDRVVALTSFKHLGNQVQVSRIMVAYRPDGSVEQFVETTDYEPAPKQLR